MRSLYGHCLWLIPVGAWALTLMISCFQWPLEENNYITVDPHCGALKDFNLLLLSGLLGETSTVLRQHNAKLLKMGRLNWVPLH